MKKIFLMCVLIMSVFAVNGAELFYSDGTSLSIDKAEGFGAVKSDSAQVVAPKNELYRLNLGKRVLSIL